MVPRQFAAHLKKWYSGYQITDVVVDCLGSQEGTGGEGFKSFIQVLNEEGVRARATTYDEKQDDAFIARIQDALVIPDGGIPKLRIFSGNFGILTDIKNVTWVKYKGLDEYKPKLDISNKDYLSCLKYALASNLHPNKDLRQSTTISRQAETYGVTKSQTSRRLSLSARRIPKGTTAKEIFLKDLDD